MHYLKRQTTENGEDAASPVVGVMLMLVVVIIIAAVVSGFAGGLIGGQQKTPALTMDVQIKNTGYYATSNFEAKVLSVTEAIPTKDLKLVTSWTNSSGGKGGATVTKATNVFGFLFTKAGDITGVAPWGYGPGVVNSNSGIPNSQEQQFGNYSLLGGTIMTAWPAGQTAGYITVASGSGYGTATQYVYDTTAWEYTPGTTVDGMQAVLGPNWESLRAGNTVNIKVIYLPSGATLLDKNVVVS